MINTINSDLIRGNINTIILKALFEGDRYGYDIVKEIEQKSSGQYKLKQPTLYSSLKRLEVQGFIRSYWGAKSNGGRRKYFTLTDMGRELFVKNQTEWEYSRTVIDRLISDKEYDLNALESNKSNAEEDESFFESDNQDSDTDYKKIFADMLDAKSIINDVKTSNEKEVAVTAIDEHIARTDEAETVSSSIENSEEKTDFSLPVKKRPKEIPNFDVSGIINNLFNSLNSQTSYSEKIVQDVYKATEKKIYSADTYFNDVKQNDYAQYETDNLNDTSAPPSITADEDAEVFENTSPDEEKVVNSLEASAEPVSVGSNATTAIENDNQSYTEFLSYKSEPRAFKENTEKILEREYKNILSDLFPKQKTKDAEPVQAPQLPAEDIPSALSLEKQQSIPENNLSPNIDSMAKDADSSMLQGYSKDSLLNQQLNKIAESSRSTTGDKLKTRIHDNRLDAIFKTQYHYYSNKLMLVHFAILFGVMLAEIILTFLFIQVGLQINREFDLFYYMTAVIAAASLPIIAAVFNFNDPNRIKRYELNFKESLVFRLLVVACCLLIIYALNVTMGMRLTFSPEYLNTLVLPSIMALNFPLSTVIFYLLYGSGKYNQIQ